MQHSQKKNASIKLCDNDGGYREEEMYNWGQANLPQDDQTSAPEDAACRSRREG